MKKVLLTIMILVLSVTALTGCGMGKEPITSEEFTEYFSDDYIMTEKSDDFDDSIVVALNAESDDIIIAFLEFSDNDAARNSFDKVTNEFEMQKNSMNVKAFKNARTNSYGSYKLTTDSQYVALVRIENTILASVVSKEFKDDVNDIIKGLGY